MLVAGQEIRARKIGMALSTLTQVEPTSKNLMGYDDVTVIDPDLQGQGQNWKFPTCQVLQADDDAADE